MKFMLDTNTCIYIINRRPPQVFDRFQGLRAGDIGVSSITAAELAFGVTKSGSQRNRAALEKFLAPLEIAAFGEDAIWQYGNLRATLEAGGRPIGSLDTLIAAHALALGAVLVTNNRQEFDRVSGLQCENWV
ncbi:MAG: type II toxin-antitoxin system VapC family toxin [Betaproteobacteria bacterium]|nr:type II toxin-antitoxin system VapC family toxin [Betaproteobacteria bacterium]